MRGAQTRCSSRLLPLDSIRATRWPMRAAPLLATASVLALALGVAPRALAGEKVRAELRYTRTDDACPDEPTMRALVASRLGYDPFIDGADLALSIDLGRQGRERVGRIALASKNVARGGERVLRSSDGDCNELASSVALAVALAIDPSAARAQPAPPELTPPPAPAPPPAPPTAVNPPSPAPRVAAPPAPPVPRPPRSPERRLGWRGDAGVVVGAGIVPGTSFGPRLGVALHGVSWSIAAEGAAIFAGTASSPRGDATTSAAFGSLVPCFDVELDARFELDLCLIGSLGALFSEARSVSRSFPTTSLLAAVGPRASLTIFPWRSLGLRLGGDLTVSLSRVHLTIDDAGTERELWASPPLSFLSAVAGVVRFP